MVCCAFAASSIQDGVGTGLSSLTAQGFFSSESVFEEVEPPPDSNQTNHSYTRIDYKLDLEARLPIPLGLRMMPNLVIKPLADNITQWRFCETVDGFIEQSLATYENTKSIDNI